VCGLCGMCTWYICVCAVCVWALLWLWRRPMATAPIRPLAWEPPYATGAALEKTKKKKKEEEKMESAN